MQRSDWSKVSDMNNQPGRSSWWTILKQNTAFWLVQSLCRQTLKPQLTMQMPHTPLHVKLGERLSLPLAVTLETCGKEKRTNKYIFQKLPLQPMWKIYQVKNSRSKMNLTTGQSQRTHILLACQMTLTSPSLWPPHSWTPWTPPPRPPSPCPPWTSWHTGPPPEASLSKEPPYQGEGPWLGPRLAQPLWSSDIFSWYKFHLLATSVSNSLLATIGVAL